MPLSNYGELKASVADWLNRPDLTTQIPDFIRLAEAEMQRRIRRKTIRRTITVSAESTELPDDLAELRYCYLKSGRPSADRNIPILTPAGLTDKRVLFPTSGRPQYAAELDHKMILVPAPDSSYTLEIIYYQKLALLATGGDGGVIVTPPSSTNAGQTGDDSGGDTSGGTGGTGGDLPLLPTGMIGDWDADNAVTAPVVGVQAFDFGANANWTGVLNVPNSTGTGGSLVTASSPRNPGYFDAVNYPHMATDLNGHSFIRHWGSISGVSPGVLRASAASLALNSLTIMAVVRPSTGGPSPMVSLLGAADVPLVGFGTGSIVQQIGGFRRGTVLGQTGEYASTGSPPTVQVNANGSYNGTWPVGLNDTHIFEGASNPEPVHGFSIVALRITTAGVLEFYKDGFLLPYTFTMPAGTYDLNTLQLDGAFDCGRVLVWPSALSGAQLTNAFRNLGGTYNITVP